MSPLKSLMPVSLKFGSGLTGELAWGTGKGTIGGRGGSKISLFPVSSLCSHY